MNEHDPLSGAGQTSPPLIGKTALVTGASRGIGASIARQLAEAGADVAINYRSKGPRAQDVASAIEALGRRSLLLQADITSPEDIASTFPQIAEAWSHLDLLILNASRASRHELGRKPHIANLCHARVALRPAIL
ncbi:SDR family NAD(P)-dependent oxidoreductase [Edaphobacter aggregans]|uniref:SDR family NAD(P)-dependent oxidoreductase n=1 Tax=Edaphobacter aggregans TaxID=570835 RepID=UPI0009FFA5A9|nr:SDR family NAD(P)-dependent oxidoreductase [Edaphobacter aggregans]